MKGVFCDDATCHAEGDYNVGLSFFLEEGVEPKIQPSAQSLAQGLMGHLPKIFESQDCEAQVK